LISIGFQEKCSTYSAWKPTREKTLTGEANVIPPFNSKSPEAFALASAVVGVLMAALLTLVPAASFGTFWQMTAILLSADLVVYLAMKLGWLKMRRDRK
jgi:hypothetical protein